MGAVTAWLLVQGGLLGPAGASHPSSCPFSVTPTAAPTSGPAPLLVEFAAGVSAGVPSSYNWSFGDGGFYNGTTSRAASAVHEYALAGQYAARLTVMESGCAVTGSVSVSVGEAPFSATLRETPVGGLAPLTVRFNGTAAGGTGTYVAFEWEFGDGDVGSGPSVEYTYARPGSFHVVLNVTDSAGNVASASEWVNVTAAPGSANFPDSPITAGAWSAITGVGVVFVALLGALAWNRARRRAAAESVDRPVRPEPGPVTRSGPSSEPSGPRPVPTPASPPLLGPAPSRNHEARSPSTLAPYRPASPVPISSDTLLSQRVVLHIARQGSARPDEVAPNELTQAGMVAGLGANQSSLAHVLRTLEAAGVVGVEVRHARGRARRVKVYVLTPRGESLARELRVAAARSRPPAAP